MGRIFVRSFTLAPIQSKFMTWPHSYCRSGTSALVSGKPSGMEGRTFEGLVRRALRRIPKEFRDAMENVEVVIEEWPDPALMEEVLGDRQALAYGLFIGAPLPEQHAGDWGGLPTVIQIYKGPLEQDFPDPEELAREVEITLVHEIAHYMGFDEDILTEYGYD